MFAVVEHYIFIFQFPRGLTLHYADSEDKLKVISFNSLED